MNRLQNVSMYIILYFLSIGNLTIQYDSIVKLKYRIIVIPTHLSFSSEYYVMRVWPLEEKYSDYAEKYTPCKSVLYTYEL